MSDPVVDLIGRTRLVAILRFKQTIDSSRLCQSLLAAGVVVQEFTLTSPGALQSVQRVRNELASFNDGSAFIGVGSIRSVDEAREAKDAGAQFAVSPTFNPDVVEYCVDNALPIACGAYTPTEILGAWEQGASIVKVFPARSLGPQFIKDVLAPLPELRLMPTGGVSLDNAQEFLSAGAYSVGIGGNIVQPEAVAVGDWDVVTQHANAYVQAINGNAR